MALAIPVSLGGDGPEPTNVNVEPIEVRASVLTIPAELGGDAPPEQLTDTGDVTQEGRPVFKNQSGDFVTERSITITDPRINQGQPTNIPTVMGGRFLSEEEAISSIVNAGGKDPITGRQLQGFQSIDEAVSAAKARSSNLLRGAPAQPLSQIVPEVAQAATQAVQQVSVPDTGITDIVTGRERIAATPELGTLPEFQAEPEQIGVAFGLLSTFDEKAQRDIIQEAIPEAVFETTPDGSTIIEIPTEGGGSRRSVLNRPGLSKRDVANATAQILSFLPSGRFAALGKTLAQKVARGAVGAGATEQALQEVGVELGRQERDPTSTAIAAVTGGAAEAVLPAIQAVRGARQAARVGAGEEEVAQVATSIQAAQEATEETGVPLFQAQQTGVPAQLEKQSFVAQLPAGTQSAITGLKAQNKAAGDAVENFLGQIAPDEAIITGAERVRTAAQNAVEKAKSIRAEKTSPLFKEALSEGADVDLNPVNTFINDQLEELPNSGEIAKSLKRVKSLISKKAKPSLRLLHNAKLELDQMLNKVGTDSLGNTTKAKLTEAKSILLQQMDEASPAYQTARQAFADASPAVTKIQESIIGKIAALDDTQLKQVSAKIFDPAQTNPKVIADAKKAITDVDPDAWNEIIRVELEKRLGKVKSTAESGTVENIPGQLFRALFPNEKSNKVLMNSLDAEGKKNLTYLKTALGRARLGRPGGSQTAGREEIKRELRGGVVKSIREFFQAPINTITNIGDDAAFNKRTREMAKALFDPTWKAEMKKVRQLKSDTPASARAMTQLLNDISTEEETNGN